MKPTPVGPPGKIPPRISGTLVVALISSLIVVAADAFFPSFRLRESVAAFLSGIDFNQTLMRGMLAFLLFAGGLHLDLDGLLEHKWTIAALATAGVVLSTAIVGALTWWVFQLVGIDIAFDVCLAFGALISPTDPIAATGLLTEMHAPRYLESLIAGESLFNDAIAVVVFFVIACVGSLAIAGGGSCLTGRGAFFAASGSRFSVIALTGSSGVPCVDFCVIT